MIESSHISSAFDADLEHLQNLILEMGGQVEAQIERATEVLQARDEDAAREVVAADKRIDAFEAEIESEAVKVLALRQPIASDLRTVVSVMKVANNLERIGDYAKNNAKRVPALAAIPSIGASNASLRRMSVAVRDMLHDVLESVVNSDSDLALDVWKRDEEVDQIYNGLFRELLTHMMEDPRNIGPCMHLLFIAKNIERIGDHVTNITEQVIYAVTGSLPDESRPKDDSTTYLAVDPDSATGDES